MRVFRQSNFSGEGPVLQGFKEFCPQIVERTDTKMETGDRHGCVGNAPFVGHSRRHEVNIVGANGHGMVWSFEAHPALAQEVYLEDIVFVIGLVVIRFQRVTVVKNLGRPTEPANDP